MPAFLEIAESFNDDSWPNMYGSLYSTKNPINSETMINRLQIISDFMTYPPSTWNNHDNPRDYLSPMNLMGKKKLTMHTKFMWSHPIHQPTPNRKTISLQKISMRRAYSLTNPNCIMHIRRAKSFFFELFPSLEGLTINFSLFMIKCSNNCVAHFNNSFFCQNVESVFF